MTMIDSSVWVAYFNGKVTRETELLNALLGVQPVVTGDLIVTEVLQGFRHDKDFEQAKKLLSSLFLFRLGSWNLAIKTAENYRFLRKKGITVRKTIDMYIGTYCIENDIPLLHADKDFEPLKIHLGLKTL